MPDDPFLKRGQEKGFPAGFVLADVLSQTGGAYQTTAPMSEKFRVCIRAVAGLTSDDGLLRIADLPEVPVSLENCRQLDPQTRFVMVCRLDVSPAETPRWRRIQPTGIYSWPWGEPRILDMCQGARIEERVILSNGLSLLRMGQPRTSRHNIGHMPDDHNPPGSISARLVSFAVDSADPAGINNYDSFAEGYTASNEDSFDNAHYERPAMLALAGEVAGRRILDAGCGSGALFAALRDRGAIVTGIDKSAGMLEQARRRLGDDADLQAAELGSPLPFPGDTFDDVTASLVLHYLRDWGLALAELRRVLKPGGRLIVSVGHPFATNLWHREAGLKPDYFATYNTVEWTAGGQVALLRFWARPLHAMTDAFTAAGFRITVISEPPVAPDTPRELLPLNVADRQWIPGFLFFVLHAS